MAKKFKAISKKGEAASADNVAVEVSITRSVTDKRVTTPLEIKNKMDALDEQIALIAAKKLELEAELVLVLKEADKLFVE